MPLVTLLECRRAKHSNPKVHGLRHKAKLPLMGAKEGREREKGREKKERENEE